MGRDDNHLIRRGSSVDTGDLKVNFVKPTDNQPDIEAYDRTLGPRMKEFPGRDPLLEGFGSPVGGDLEAS